MKMGFGHVQQVGGWMEGEERVMTRESYVGMFGPTVGDRVRLGDTNLWIEVEADMVRSSLPPSLQ